jgi:hypothetical protein
MGASSKLFLEMREQEINVLPMQGQSILISDQNKTKKDGNNIKQKTSLRTTAKQPGK